MSNGPCDEKTLQEDLQLAYSLWRYHEWDGSMLALNMGRCSGTISRLVERIRELEQRSPADRP